MLAEEKTRRQDELEKCLYEISCEILSSDEKIRKIALQLLEIYKGDFRHSYSGFFPVILKISEEGNEYNLEFLSASIEALREYIEKDFVKGEKEFEEMYGSIAKLCDHVNLEIGRLNYYLINESRMKDLESKTKAVNEELTKATKELEVASVKAEGIQTQLVAVLGIFAAIVLSFTGSFAFTSSVLENFQSGNIYRWLLVILLVGLVLINILYALFYFINRIIHNSTEKRMGPIVIPNVVILGLLVVLVIVWNSGVIEKVQKRNAEGFYREEQQNSISISDLE